MKRMKFKLAAAAIVFASAISSIAVFAHQSEHKGMYMMGGHMENMGGMADMMTMMSSMSDEERAAMQDACAKMMQVQSEPHSGHHEGAADQ